MSWFIVNTTKLDMINFAWHCHSEAWCLHVSIDVELFSEMNAECISLTLYATGRSVQMCEWEQQHNLYECVCVYVRVWVCLGVFMHEVAELKCVYVKERERRNYVAWRLQMCDRYLSRKCWPLLIHISCSSNITWYNKFFFINIYTKNYMTEDFKNNHTVISRNFHQKKPNLRIWQ